MHLLHRPAGNRRIVSGVTGLLSNLGIPEFKIGHVDIENVFDKLQRLDAVITAAVVNQGHPKAIFNGKDKRFKDLWYDMGRRDKIDVMAAHLLQLIHHCSQLHVSDLLPALLVADVVILAKSAHQIAMGKEYGAGSI
jgi:hypothetical protein